MGHVREACLVFLVLEFGYDSWDPFERRILSLVLGEEVGLDSSTEV